MKEEEEEDNGDNEHTFDDILNQTTTTTNKEIERLSQLIIRELPTSHNEVAHILLNLLDLVNHTPIPTNMNTDQTSSSSSNLMNISSHPYTPIQQAGVVLDHDRPFADYGHLGM
jgi:hypothetical protein